VDLVEFRPHLDAELRVEVGEGFVHQEHGRLPDDGAAERDALLLATGGTRGFPVEEIVDLEEFGGVVDSAVDLVVRVVPDPEGTTCSP